MSRGARDRTPLLAARTLGALTAAVCVLLALGAGSASADVTELISANTSGVDSINNAAFLATLSADGRFVAFQSESNDLAPGETDYDTDTFVRDRQTGVTERVSVPTAGGQTANRYSGEPAISANGRYVVFGSNAPEFAPNGDGTHRDQFIHDRVTGVTERVSVDRTDPAFGANAETQVASVSADGRFIAYGSSATNLVAGAAPVLFDVFLYDRQLGTTIRVSKSIGNATQGGNAGSGVPTISADGRYVTYYSAASDLVAGDTNNLKDVFVYDRVTETTERISKSTAGTQANGESGFTQAAISANGRYVAFESQATNLVGTDTNGHTDIFVRDRQLGTTQLVSVSSSGAQSNADAQEPAISDDGQKIAFASVASNLKANDANDASDIFIRNRGNSTTKRVSNSVDGGDPQGFSNPVLGIYFYGSMNPGISSDGGIVAFSSDAFNLTSDAVNDGAEDVFATDLNAAPPVTRTLTVTPAGSGSGSVTGSGIYCPGDCSETYADGASVTLTATAADGSTFAGWSGGCTGTGTCSLTMGADKAVTATFNETPPPTVKHTLDVAVYGSGSGRINGPGINCPGDCTQTFNEGTNVTLTATPGASSSFSGWSGSCSGTGGCGVSMDSDVEVDATFDLVDPNDGPPDISTSVKRSQPLQKKLKVSVGCDQDCSIVVNGKLMAGKGKKGKTKLKPARAVVDAGDQATLKPKLSGAGLKAATKAIKKGKSVTAKLTVQATDSAGESAAKKLKVKLVGKR